MPLAQPSGGIEELVDADSGREIVVAPAVVNRFAELRKKYEEFLILTGTEWKEWLGNHVPEVVLPCDISLFLQSTHDYENHTNYQKHTGLFISQLIKNSYNAGNSDFELDMNALKPIHYLAIEVSGTKEQMVRVVITGEVGSQCGWNAQHSTFTIEKAGYLCGKFAQHSTFTIEKVANGCGWLARHSIFTIRKAGDLCGVQVENSTFTIEKAENDCGIKAEYSIFRTHNPEQYDQFKKSVTQNKENAIYLLSADDSVLKGGSW